MNSHSILKKLDEEKIGNANVLVEEALFGFSHLQKIIGALNPNSDILEVGCGSGILTAMLAETYSEHNFVGIEPFGDGFSKFKSINNVVQQTGVNLLHQRYESHKAKYDIIYCVNVFEHVNDWRHFLSWAYHNLKANGIFFVLCPNYGLPYESHFKIPILINKELTFQVFNRHIKKIEAKNHCRGLWKSLNFVKKRDVINFCNQNFSNAGFKLHDDIKIIDGMIKRLSEDTEFRKRQFTIGMIASFLRHTGLLYVLKKFPNKLPYMKLIFIKS